MSWAPTNHRQKILPDLNASKLGLECLAFSGYEDICDRIHDYVENHNNTGWKQRVKKGLDEFILRGCKPISRYYNSNDPGAFGILMYHRVSPKIAGIEEPTWNVTPDQMEKQLKGLIQLGFTPVPLSEAVQHHQLGLDLPHNAFVVTFDDGYANNFTQAFPVLERLGVPATIFLATAYLGEDVPFPSDDWSQTGKADPDTWRPLTLEEAHQLNSSDLIELGSHTHTHDDFRGRPRELQQDVELSLSFMKREFDILHPTFAFPFGVRRFGFSSDDLIKAVKQTRVRCSLSTESQLAHLHQSPYYWGRFTATQADDAERLAVKLSGWYSRVKNGMRRLARR
ncbi:Poly-beta-1,6-N-acetyl-D-glucosamine N-deacetylase precursor [Polystyrenella longa]|uniref:Poly-beta-1,6-N-acetyl-D-glucosamine N-deacetylase n=1 Tax=Polystyrenella longa TaxID=2528007 RepID=A0A518CQ04_9PLAN|nr:polysaccharide deacetylase family protein [Polystyrenella longa]QDU81307.1 Poly-beta-1,6-N-acetyl-D-glucosamine N-deacetylase precursor [Polystyrenella longa]